jgi:hypothetical protein
VLLIKEVPKEKSTKGMTASTFTKELRSIKWGDRANLSDVALAVQYGRRLERAGPRTA